jgi:hypothetical protein
MKITRPHFLFFDKVFFTNFRGKGKNASRWRTTRTVKKLVEKRLLGIWLAIVVAGILAAFLSVITFYKFSWQIKSMIQEH